MSQPDPSQPTPPEQGPAKQPTAPRASDTPQRDLAHEITRAMLDAGAKLDPTGAGKIMNAISKEIDRAADDTDQAAAMQRVRQLREQYPDLTTDQIIERLIMDKVKRTSLIGASTTGAGLIPGIGTFAALTIGVAADISATFKAQSELVLEIAAAYDAPLKVEEKQRAILLVTGLSAGSNQLARQFGKRATFAMSERVAQRWVAHALPIIGIAASAGTNALSTYIIGQRAKAYFGRSPEAMGDWGDNLRAISGVDERKIGAWMSEARSQSQVRLGQGLGVVAQGGRTAAGTFQRGVSGVVGLLGKVIGGVFGVAQGVLGGIVNTITRRKPSDSA